MPRPLVCFFLIAMLMFVYSGHSQPLMDEIDINRRGVDVIEVKSGFAELTLTRSNDHITHVKGRIWGNSTSRLYRFDTSLENKVLTIEAVSPLTVRNDVGAQLMIGIPPQVKVLIISTTGKVHIVDYRSDSIEVQSKSGLVEVLKSTGTVNIKTDGADVLINAFDGEAQIAADGGTIQVINCSGGLDLSTTSGSIEGTKLILDRNSYFKTQNGAINLSINQPESFFSTDLMSNGRLSWFGEHIADDSYRKVMGRVYLRATSGTGNISIDFNQDEMSRK